MPKRLKLPYRPLIVVESDGPLSWRKLAREIGARLQRGVSFCLTAARGRQDRGGYFFHMRSRDRRRFVLSTFDRPNICIIEGQRRCVSFINHVSGRRYNERMWILSQIANLRPDPDTRTIRRRTARK